MCDAGLVYATGTEDMDALTFRTPILVRKMTFASASKSTVQTMNYKKALEGLDLNHDQFVDLCILLGCDYCDSIKGVGPKTALKLIREFGNIETILEKGLEGKKWTVPDSWQPPKDEYSDDEGDENTENNKKPVPVYVEARKLFNHHEVLDKSQVELKWKAPQVEELKKFLVDQHGFNPERVASSIEKLEKAHKANAKPQARMDSFFAIKTNPVSAAKRKKKLEELKAAKKRKTSSKKR